LQIVLEKISELTPHQSQIKKTRYTKKIKSLEVTKKYYKESNQYSGVELKEFSLIYLMIHNLNTIKENINLLNGLKIFSNENKIIFNSIIERLKLEEKVSLEDLDLDKQIIDKINRFTPIKHILKNKSNNDYEVIEILEDIKRDLNNYDLDFRIQELESRFSKDFSEDTFNELKELKKRQNIN
jgi:DNA primase